MPLAAVLFDVDGTLVDSNYHHAIAWARALRDHGHRIPVAAVHRLIGMGGSEMLETLIGTADEAIEKGWRTNFDAMLSDLVAFDGAGDLVRAVHATGARVVMATSSPQDLFDELRTRVDADDAVDDVVTQTDVENAKPHPDIFQVALRKAGTDAADTVVVGDSVWDIEAATKAGLRCIAVECGGYSSYELEKAGAAAVYRDPRDLLDNLHESVFA